MNPEVTPAWMVVVIIAREFAVSSLRGFAASEGLVLAASASAKLKTTLQIIAISLLIFYNQLDQFARLAPICLWLAMLVSLYSGVEYFFRHGPELLRRGSRTA
jgi:CDP-diacylglycerol--glycerol-3-phosphate 3-phosphatidyltransferase